jgi:phospholipid/cholesterol/gamma-HCH transport system substrate-binding protein
MSDNALFSWLRSPLGIGTAVLVLFGGAVVFGLNATHGMPLAERREVLVAFEDLSGLNTGDDVRIAGNRVGYVEDLRLEDGQAVAVLKLDDPDTELYENAQAARISDRSGLGQKFVTLDPGDPSTGALRSDAIIPADQTVKTEDLNELFDTFDEKTRAEAATALQNLGGGMIAHGEDMHAFTRSSPELLASTGEVSKALAAGKGAPLEDLLVSADRLTGRMATRDEELAALIDEMAVTVDAFAADDGNQVRASLDQAPDTLDAAHSALSGLDAPLADLAVAMRQVRPGATALGRSTPDLRAFLREAVTPLGKVPDVNEDAETGVVALDRLVSDARPLAHQLLKTASNGAPVASVLGDYAEDIAYFHTNASGALSSGDSAGHWLRILLLPGVESVGVPGSATRDPYPAPGETW